MPPGRAPRCWHEPRRSSSAPHDAVRPRCGHEPGPGTRAGAWPLGTRALSGVVVRASASGPRGRVCPRSNATAELPSWARHGDGSDGSGPDRRVSTPPPCPRVTRLFPATARAPSPSLRSTRWPRRGRVGSQRVSGRGAHGAASAPPARCLLAAASAAIDAHCPPVSPLYSAGGRWASVCGPPPAGPGSLGSVGPSRARVGRRRAAGAWGACARRCRTRRPRAPGPLRARSGKEAAPPVSGNERVLWYIWGTHR